MRVIIQQLSDVGTAVSAILFTFPSCLHDCFLDISANHSVPLRLMQKAFYRLDELNGLWEFKDFIKRPRGKGTTNYVP